MSEHNTMKRNVREMEGQPWQKPPRPAAVPAMAVETHFP